MSTWMPQPCMSQDCLFQNVTSPGQFWGMASRISQAEFSHGSKKWWKQKVGFPACTEILMCLVSDRSRQTGDGEGERGGDLCVHREWGSILCPSLPELISLQHSPLLQMSNPAGYKTFPVTLASPDHHITTQPGLHIMGPESEPATSP